LIWKYRLPEKKNGWKYLPAVTLRVFKHVGEIFGIEERITGKWNVYIP